MILVKTDIISGNVHGGLTEDDDNTRPHCLNHYRRSPRDQKHAGNVSVDSQSKKHAYSHTGKVSRVYPDNRTPTRPTKIYTNTTIFWLLHAQT